MRELVQLGRSKRVLPWGLLCGTSGKGILCMVPCHICQIYGIWRSKEVRRTLKSSFGVAMQATRKGTILMGKGCIGWDWQGQKCKLKCPKVYEINSELYCNCNLFLYPFLWYKYLYPQPHKNTFVATENPWYLNEVYLKSKNIPFHVNIQEISTLKSGYIIFNKTVCWYVIVAFF